MPRVIARNCLVESNLALVNATQTFRYSRCVLRASALDQKGQSRSIIYSGRYPSLARIFAPFSPETANWMVRHFDPGLGGGLYASK